MFFGFAIYQKESNALFNKTIIFGKISQKLISFFKSKNYGNSLEELIICLLFSNLEFFKLRKKPQYSEKKKKISYDLSIDHNEVINSDDIGIKKIIENKVLSSIKIILDFKLDDFNYEAFKNDIQYFIDNELPKIE